MNELVTPPGYSEYPRDPKFRPTNPIVRLHAVTFGYLILRTWGVILVGLAVVIPNVYLSASFRRGWAAIVVVGLGMLVMNGMDSICSGKGWSRLLSVALVIVSGLIAMLAVVRIGPAILSSGLACAVPIAVVYYAYRLASSEFEKFGMRLSPGMGQHGLAKMVKDLLANDPEYSAIAAGSRRG